MMRAASSARADLAGLSSMPVWSDETVRAAGLTVRDAPLLSIGGGLASFALVDRLRICGVEPAEIRVVSPLGEPYENLRNLMFRSQIVENEPLRSDSMSRIDNIWGFPGYALEAALAHRSLRPLWNVLTEPVLTEFFNPTPEQVFRGIDREAARIGWHSMLVPGHVELVRKREGGGYLSLVRPADGTARFAYRSDYLHVATGYPGVRYLPQVSEYRAEHRDYLKVVNAYERHEHVYQILRRRPGTVVVRGAGITAARILQRLFDDRERFGKDTRVIQLMRTYVEDSKGPWWFRRPGGEGWRYQAFTAPKAAAGGQLRHRLLRLDDARRVDFVRSITVTTSPRRRRWRRQLEHARRDGCYEARHADIKELAPASGGGVNVLLDSEVASGSAPLEADFVIDCTGLAPELNGSPLLSDLLATGARGNALGGLDAGPHLEVAGMASEPGQMYASGVIARGGSLVQVDSFWGFSHAAVLICDDLAGRGFCAGLGWRNSVASWLKWITRREP